MKRSFLVISALIFSLLTAPAAMADTVLSDTAGGPTSYVENAPEVLFGTGITFTGESPFAGGYLEFEVGTSAITDILSLQKVSTAITTLDVVSVVGNTIYKGDGTTANPVASIDATLDGTAGKKLRINFSSSFTNSGFETGDFTGWEYINSRIDIGVTTLAGVVSSDADNVYPNTCGGSSLNDNDAPASASYNYEFSTSQKTEGTQALRLYSSMTTANGGDVVHGPAVVSNEFAAAAGDIISFDWSAVNGGDNYDVYGYLINSATGAQTEVIDSDGVSQAWTTKSATIPATGNYRFVFINGTHDLSCGRAAGGSLYIDNVQVASASVSAATAQAIARLVTYRSTSDNPATTKTVTLNAHPSTGTVAPLSLTINITSVDDGVVPSDTAITFTDTTATDTFTQATGTIVASDPDTATAGTTTFGILGGTLTAGVSSKTGTFGVLTIDESTGAYTYTPNDSAINGVVINTSESFTLTSLTGALSSSAIFTVNIVGAAEAGITAPTISGLTPNTGPTTGGTTVTITGTGFTGAQFVKFGTSAGTNLTIVSDTSLTVQAPAKLAGAYNVTVINGGGTNSGTYNYTYYIPVASPPGTPGTPTAVAGDKQATITIVAPTTGGTPITYTVTSNPGGLTCTVTVPATSCTVTGLTNGTSYTFTSTATNADGTSSPSAASSAVTPQPDPAIAAQAARQAAEKKAAEEAAAKRAREEQETQQLGLAVLALGALPGLLGQLVLLSDAGSKLSLGGSANSGSTSTGASLKGGGERGVIVALPAELKLSGVHTQIANLNGDILGNVAYKIKSKKVVVFIPTKYLNAKYKVIVTTKDGRSFSTKLLY